jgi:hypothetical protein
VALIPIGVGAKDGYAIVEAYDAWVSAFKWINGSGYAVTSIEGQTISMHRLLMGDPDGMLVDHRDEYPRNNRRFNIREADKSGNMSNRGLQKNNTSGYKGVWYHKQLQKWAVEIKFRQIKRFLGVFDSPEEGAAAYNLAATHLHGEFAKLYPVPDGVVLSEPNIEKVLARMVRDGDQSSTISRMDGC